MRKPHFLPLYVQLAGVHNIYDAADSAVLIQITFHNELRTFVSK